MDGNHVRVLFQLEKDADGYPPVDIEGLWAQPIGHNLFKIDNVPFFVKGISCDDVVEAFADREGELRFKSLVKPSLRNTLRVIVFRESPDRRPLGARVSELRDRLAEIGCSTELSHAPGLVAIDASPESFEQALEVLRIGERSDLWEYEEASIRS